MDKARPGTWFSRGYSGDGADEIQFDCCKQGIHVGVHTVRRFKNCPFCGQPLLCQRAVRPKGIPAWALKHHMPDLGECFRVRPERHSVHYEIQTCFSSTGLWSDAARVWPQPGELPAVAAIRTLREAMGDMDSDGWPYDEKFRIVRRHAAQIVGVVESEKWVIKTSPVETERRE
jgi:hypothetical protein